MRIQNGGQTAPTLAIFFQLMIPIPFQVGHHRPVSETPFKWPNGLTLAGECFVILQGC